MFKVEFEIRLHSQTLSKVVECFCGEIILGSSDRRVLYDYLKHLVKHHRLVNGELYFKRNPKPTYIYISQNHYLLRNVKVNKSWVKVQDIS